MNIPLQTILFSIPALIYLAFLKKRGDDWTEAFRKIGWRGSRLVYYLWSIGICGLIGGFVWLAFRLVPAEIFQDPNLNISAYGDLPVSFSSFIMILIRKAFNVALPWLSSCRIPSCLQSSFVNCYLLIYRRLVDGMATS